MSAHTPGPWSVDLDRFAYTNSGQRSIFYQPVSEGSLTHIAYVSSVIERSRKTSYNAPDEVRDANARLIAAAPDLLAALEAIELALRLPNVTAGEILDENSPIRDGIRTALAKAKGEA